MYRRLVIFVIFMGFGDAKRWGDTLKSSSWVPLQAKRRGRVAVCMEKEGSHYVRLLYWNFIVSFTGYCKTFYRILLLPILLLLYLFYIYWDWQGQKWNLKCPKGLGLIMNYSDTKSLLRIHLLQLKINNI